MHETLSPNFKGYIDNFFIDGDNLRFSGWLVTTNPRDQVVYYLDNGNNIAFFNYNERSDVAKFYNTTDDSYLKSGFDITINDVLEKNINANLGDDIADHII